MQTPRATFSPSLLMLRSAANEILWSGLSECQVSLDFFQSGLTLHSPPPFFGSVPLQVANASGSPVQQGCLSLLVPLRFMDSADPALTLLHCVSSFLLNRPYALLLLLPRPSSPVREVPSSQLLTSFCAPLCCVPGCYRSANALRHLHPSGSSSFCS